MKYCLSKKKISGLISYQILEEACTDDELEKFVDLAKTWDAELLTLNYILGIVLLSFKKRTTTQVVLDTLDKTFKLEEKIYLTLESLDEDFIHYLLKFKSDPEIDSAEELREFQEDYNNYRYDKTIRY